ncbi:MAG: N-acetylmuramoyl-L-alanine amidase family protein, partial [Acidimicrobiales bacterium]
VDEAGAVDGVIRNADAATASAGRSPPAEPGSDSGSDSEPGSDPGDGGSEPASSTTTGDDRPDDSPTEPAQPASTVPYPEITDEITPAQGGVRALLSPTGVLVGVTGQTSSGYVVETPCGGVTTLVWGQPIAGAQVVLDPGHGGDEAGANEGGQLTEAELNLRLARRTAAELTERSISVVLTRNGDYRIPISRRAALADSIGPEAFVSIHHNTPASRPSPQPGTEVFVQTASDRSRRLGGLLYEEVFGALSQFDVEWTSRDDAGVLSVVNDDGEDAYGIARYPTTTSALIEMAYLGNEKEAVLLATDDYLEAAAIALADGIQRFLTTEEPGTGFVDQPRVFNPSGVTGGTTGCVDPPLE